MKFKFKKKSGQAVLWLSIIACLLGSEIASAQPFGSWINVQTECGAVGDGKADDTAAIQKGLDLIRPEDSKRKILYFPAGTYRITGTVKAIREKHRECQGVGLQGEGPDKSVIVYDGVGNEPMLEWGAWYSTIRGLGFETANEVDRRSEIGDRGAEVGGRKSEDGNAPSANSQLPSSAKPAKPTAGIWFGPRFSTANEVSDCVFRGLPIALQAGDGTTQGQAEVAVRRCVFERCGIGISIQNWNSLDWWVWDSTFLDCGVGLSNVPGCGNFYAYRCEFEGSQEADARIGHLGGFGLVGNHSKKSRLFLDFQLGHSAGGNITLQGNRVEGTVHPEGLCVYIGNAGPALFLDNEFLPRAGTKGPAIRFESRNRQKVRGNALLIGNTTTGGRLYEAEKNYEVRVIEDGDVSDGIKMKIEEERDLQSVKLTHQTVVEVEAGAGGDQIQAALDGAREGATVHLPAGEYRLTSALKLPAGKKLKLAGDGLLNATRLVAGQDFQGEALVEALSPSRMELADLWIDAGRGEGARTALAVAKVDQTGSLVHGDQLHSEGWDVGMEVQNLDGARVVLENHGHNGMRLSGGSLLQRGEASTGRVEILCGASSRGGSRPGVPIYDVRAGGRMWVRDIWYEGDPEEYLHLKDRGEFVQCGNRIATNKARGHGTEDAIVIEGKAGLALLAQCSPHGANLRVGRIPEGFTCLLYGLTPYPETKVELAAPGKNCARLFCRQNNLPGTGSEPLEDLGDVSDEMILRVMEPLRRLVPVSPEEPPDGSTALRIHRAFLNGRVGVRINGGG